MSPFDLVPGAVVVRYLRTPREKLWGVLLSLQPAGIVIRGLDLLVCDDWVRQEQRGEEGIGLSTLFYPMARVERMEQDEGAGPIESLSDRFRRNVGRSVFEVMGIPLPAERADE